MTYSLIKSSICNKNIFVWYHNNTIIKETYKICSRKELLREFNGLKWYYENSKYSTNINKLNLLKFNKSTRLTIPCFEGNILKVKNSIFYNIDVFKTILLHYQEVWGQPNNKRVNFHGDLSLGNICYSNSKVHFIDWEYFRRETLPYGFDLLNLFYECLFYFTYYLDFTLIFKSKVYDFYELFIETLAKSNNFLKYFEFRNLLLQNTNIWGSSIVKLPVLKFSPRQINLLLSFENKFFKTQSFNENLS